MYIQSLEDLRSNGFVLLKSVISPSEILKLRQLIIDYSFLLKNTRPTPWSGHLAGFHRYKELEYVNKFFLKYSIQEFLNEALGCKPIFAGLTDITYNRSQEWHVDLLRGKYKGYLDEDICYGENSGNAFKVLCYLQQSNSLKLLLGSHKKLVKLDDDSFVRPKTEDEIIEFHVQAGDVVIMDIRLIHRGAPEEAFKSENFITNPKILVSSVYGDNNLLTKKMIEGNSIRLIDWDKKNAKKRSPLRIYE